MSVTHKLAVKYVALADLTPHPENPRRGNVDAIAASLERNGQFRPIVVSEATGYVVAGNHTLRAAHTLGWDVIAVTYLKGLTPEDERRIMLADNRASDLGDYDAEAQLAMLESLTSLEGSLYTADDLEALAALVSGELAGADDDDFDEEPLPSGGGSPSGPARAAEVCLVLSSLSRRSQLLDWFEALRARWGEPDISNGEVVYRVISGAIEK